MPPLLFPIVNFLHYHNTFVTIKESVFPVVKDLPANAGDTVSIPGLGRFPREGPGNPLQAIHLPGKSHGQRRLAGYSPWDHTESDMT